MFKGSIVALITPFKDGKIDEQAFQSFVEWQINQGTEGLIPTGTTGESPTLSHQEHQRIVDLVVEVAKKRVPIIAGTGSNSTDEAVSLTKHAQHAGVDAALIVTPYYNKPTQEGLYQHFKKISDSTKIPIIIYNIPGRSVIDMNIETIARLRTEGANIIGIKDATGDLARPILTRNIVGTDFCQLSGEDGTAIPFLAAGGHGCISVTANVAPSLCSEMQRAWQEGNITKAMDLQFKLMPLHSALFCEPSPGPVKYAAARLGWCSAETRLPLCKISEASKIKVDTALKAVGLIS